MDVCDTLGDNPDEMILHYRLKSLGLKFHPKQQVTDWVHSDGLTSNYTRASSGSGAPQSCRSPHEVSSTGALPAATVPS